MHSTRQEGRKGKKETNGMKEKRKTTKKSRRQRDRRLKEVTQKNQVCSVVERQLLVEHLKYERI